MEKVLPSVQAIIVTWNKKADVLALLSQLKAIRYPQERLSILVVDNASTDGTAKVIAAEHPEVRLIEHAQNLGGAGGFNAGMRWTLTNRPCTAYLWLLDNDVRIHPDALIGLVNVLETYSDAAVCGSRIMDTAHQKRLIEVGAFIDYQRGDVRRNEPDDGRPTDPGAVYKVDYVAACSLLARTSVVRRLGLWREDFFIYWDDMEWGVRLNTAGFEVLATNASIVFHPSWANRNADRSANWRTYYRIRNSLWFFNAYGRGYSKHWLLCKMVIRYGIHALNAAIQTNNELSRAFIRGIEHFFSHDFGKKTFDMDPLSLFSAIEAGKIQDIMIFVPDDASVHHARRLVDDIAGRFHGIGIRCILPESAMQSWSACRVLKNRMFYLRNPSGGIPLADKYKISRFFRSQSWQLLICSAQTPKLGVVWGRPVARIDFCTTDVLSLDRMDLKGILRLMNQLPAMVARAVFSTPDPYPLPEQ